MNLAYRMRPQTLQEFSGQEHLVGEGKILQQMLFGDQLFSMILWGPPGSGKTTLAHIIANQTKNEFYQLSGVASGKEDLMKIIKQAKEQTPSNKLAMKLLSKRVILFIDEIHRWNKAQQDALLPHVESGLITLIGATTENPSFEIISALLSRCRVFVLKSLDAKDLEKIIERALKYYEAESADEAAGPLAKKQIEPDAKELLIRLSGGDARIMLNALEMAVSYSSSERSESRDLQKTRFRQAQIITSDIIKEVFQTRSAGLYDKKADEHYNIISAFIKSLRGSDADAALYYLARMLENGEDPKFIARRMIIFSSEDIGLADRGALIQANAGFEAVTKIGMPEAQLILAHIALYLATAKKSRAVANALGKAKQAVYDLPNEPVPLHLRNAPSTLMKSVGYAKDYTWSEHYVGPTNKQSFLPEKLKGKKFFEP